MKKFLLGLLAVGSIIGCSKDEPSPTLPTGENKLIVNLNGPDGWFGNKSYSTGKGNPSEEYKTGPYYVELFSGTERVAYLKDVYTYGDAPQFDEDSGIVAGTTYEVRVHPQLNNGEDGEGNHHLMQMWDTGFNLEGKLSLTFGGQEQAENVTIAPTNISQLSVTGNPYKVTFQQFHYSTLNDTWYQQSLYNTYNVPDVVFEGATIADRSIYWNVEGVPDTESMPGESGQYRRFESVPHTTTTRNNMLIKVIIQPVETSTDTYEYFVSKDNSPANYDEIPGYADTKHILKNAAANNNYTINFDVEELQADLLSITDADGNAFTVDINDLANATATSIGDYTEIVEPQPDDFNDIVFGTSGYGVNRAKVFNPDNFDGINGGYCIGVAGVTIGDAASEITTTYDADANTITFDTTTGLVLVYNANNSTMTVDGYEGSLSETGNINDVRVSFGGDLTNAGTTSSWTLHFRMKDFDSNYAHNCN